MLQLKLQCAAVAATRCLCLCLCVCLCVCVCVTEAAYPGAATPDGIRVDVWATGLATPRGIVVAANGDVLVVERGSGRYGSSHSSVNRISGS